MEGYYQVAGAIHDYCDIRKIERGFIVHAACKAIEYSCRKFVDAFTQPRHLRRCTLCKTRALGDERHFVFDCPRFAHVRRQFHSLYQDADGTMQCFVWHKDQKAVCHCLTAILNLADDSNQDASSKANAG